MLTSLIEHYIRMLDFQTAAMIACAFHHQKVEDVEKSEEPWSKVIVSSLIPTYNQPVSSGLYLSKFKASLPIKIS
jgi:hypothetical protein